MLLTFLALCASSSAWAGPDASLTATGHVGTIGPAGAVAGRLRWSSGIQLGARVELARPRGWYLDGWPVRDGAAVAGLLGASLPLVRADGLRVDLELDVGLRTLRATDTDAPTDRALVALADVSPMATLPLGSAGAVRLGFKQLTHLQVQPSSAVEAQGSLVRGALVGAPSEDLQLGIEGTTGGVFGFDGDGGKAVGQVGLLARWVPGAARTFTNH